MKESWRKAQLQNFHTHTSNCQSQYHRRTCFKLRASGISRSTERPFFSTQNGSAVKRSKMHAQGRPWDKNYCIQALHTYVSCSTHMILYVYFWLCYLENAFVAKQKITRVVVQLELHKLKCASWALQNLKVIMGCTSWAVQHRRVTLGCMSWGVQYRWVIMGCASCAVQHRRVTLSCASWATQSFKRTLRGFQERQVRFYVGLIGSGVDIQVIS